MAKLKRHPKHIRFVYKANQTKVNLSSYFDQVWSQTQFFHCLSNDSWLEVQGKSTLDRFLIEILEISFDCNPFNQIRTVRWWSYRTWCNVIWPTDCRRWIARKKYITPKPAHLWHVSLRYKSSLFRKQRYIRFGKESIKQCNCFRWAKFLQSFYITYDMSHSFQSSIRSVNNCHN